MNQAIAAQVAEKTAKRITQEENQMLIFSILLHLEKLESLQRSSLEKDKWSQL